MGSLLFFLYMVIFTPLYGLMFFVLCPFTSIAQRQQLAFLWTAINIRTLALLCGVRYKVEGTEHLPNRGSIIMAKHQSTWETFAIPAMIRPRQMSIVYKRELHYVPVFGWGIKMLGMVPIDRKHGVEAFEHIKQTAGDRLQQGSWMMFFPEGTRVPVGFKRRYKTGGARLSLATGAPVVPVAHNAGECWPRGSFWKRPGLITLRFGPPIDPKGHTVDSLNTAIETWIETQMHEISPHRYQGPETPLLNNKR
jgi:1-acyl-sn-glycerol-3-phosphate acyltransferase